MHVVRRLRATYATLSFAPDGGQILALGRNLVSWDLSSGKRTQVAKPLPNMSSVAFSRNGECLAVKNTSGRVAVLSAIDMSVLAGPVDEGHGEGPAILAGSEEDTFVVPSWTGYVSLRSSSLEVLAKTKISTGMLTQLSPDDRGERWAIVRSVDDSRELAVTGSLFEVEPRTVELPSMSIHNAVLFSDDQAVVTFRPSHPTFETPFGELPSSTVIAWVDLRSGSLRRSVLWEGVFIDDLAVSADQHVAVTGYFSASSFRARGEPPAMPALGLVPADGKAEVTAVELPAEVNRTLALSFSPDGSLLAVGTNTGGLVFQVD